VEEKHIPQSLCSHSHHSDRLVCRATLHHTSWESTLDYKHLYQLLQYIYCRSRRIVAIIQAIVRSFRVHFVSFTRIIGRNHRYEKAGGIYKLDVSRSKLKKIERNLCNNRCCCYLLALASRKRLYPDSSSTSTSASFSGFKKSSRRGACSSTYQHRSGSREFWIHSLPGNGTAMDSLNISVS
jgi:hypothetical protein